MLCVQLGQLNFPFSGKFILVEKRVGGNENEGYLSLRIINSFPRI